MSLYKETIKISGSEDYLYACWNTSTNTCTIFNSEGRVILSGTDDEVLAVKELLNRINREYNSDIGNKFQ